MSQRPPCVSRADLLRLMDSAGEIDDRAAAACGFTPWPPGRVDSKGTDKLVTGDAGPTSTGADGDGSNSATSKPTPWPFVRVSGFEKGGPIVAERVDSKHPLLTNAELRVRNANPGTKTPPLVPWPRLVAFLRSVLGRSVKTSRIHDRKLGSMLARGIPLSSLPRLTRRAWVPRAVILWDKDWREMSPYREDFSLLELMLERGMGKSALKIIPVNGPPALRQLAELAPEVPVLAISTLGQYQGEPKALAAWATVAKRLTHRGHPIAALSPCPRRFWRGQVSAVWPITVWDGRPRPSRRSALQHFVPAQEPISQATETLLELLSPAARVERPLLRNARLRLGHPNDVGCEWEAWFHPLGWHSSDSFGLFNPAKPGSPEEQATRLQRRREHSLVREMDRLIQNQHQHHAPLIELEATLRSAFSRGNDACEAILMLQRVIERLRQMDPEAGNPDDQRSNIAPWFVEMVDRIPPQQREDSALSELIAEGLGLAHRFLQTEQIDWAQGVQVEIALRALQSEIEPPDHARKYRLGMKTPSFSAPGGKELLLSSVSNEPQRREFPTGVIAASRAYLHVSADSSKKGASHSFLLSGAEHPLGGSSREPIGEFRLESDLEKLICERFTRPAWARRLWYDRHGLAVEFRVKDVPFVLRWVPPGRFLMGSPEDEPGRRGDEGPRHERVIEKGFWLGETVVTQAQWLAVTGKNPSQFKGPGNLPVEQVAWEECRDYCEKLNALVPGPGFRLPWEQEWEHACRAGTDTALWTGGITIREDYDAPELEDIAWYVGNSWKEPRVENLYDMKSHDWRHPEGAEAGTHAVKGKESNLWGLYDMLGNVWEWCEDAWDAEAYAKFERGEPLPKGDEDALRVVRGGSWFYHAGFCRAAFRFGSGPDFRRYDLGFRLAAGQEPGAAEPLGSGATLPKNRAERDSQPKAARRAGDIDPA